jgi:hypothetical protein
MRAKREAQVYADKSLIDVSANDRRAVVRCIWHRKECTMKREISREMQED